MPCYKYGCDNCGHTFMEVQMVADKKLKKCPECKKRKLERLITGKAGVVFKGSGFYENDYKKKEIPKDDEEQNTKDKSDSAESNK